MLPAEFDSLLQSNWLMPQEYKELDIEAWLYEQTPPWDPEHSRVQEELEAFKNRNMLDLLRWMKYFVDTCRANNVVWGVGRGSSVASYVLYLIGVHKIDSLKYNLDWQEFLR
jgi:DNA polymerase III alpha subunit